MIFKAYHLDNGEGHRDEVIVPDSLMVQTLHLRRLLVLKLLQLNQMNVVKLILKT